MTRTTTFAVAALLAANLGCGGNDITPPPPPPPPPPPVAPTLVIPEGPHQVVLTRSLVIPLTAANATSCRGSVNPETPNYGYTQALTSRVVMTGCASLEYFPGSTFPRQGRKVTVTACASNGNSTQDVCKTAEVSLVVQPNFTVDTLRTVPSPLRSTDTSSEYILKCNSGCFPSANGMKSDPGTNFFGTQIGVNILQAGIIATYFSPKEVRFISFGAGRPPGQHYVYACNSDGSCAQVSFTVIP